MQTSPRAVLNDALRRYRSQGGSGVIRTRLFAAIAVLVLLWRTPLFEERATILWALATYMVTIVPLLLISADSFKKVWVRVIPDVLDLLLVSVVIADTGGLESPWFPFYLFPLMSASRYLGPLGTSAMAAFAIICYAWAGFAANVHPWLKYPFWLRAFVLSGAALTVANIARGRRDFQALVYKSPDMIIVLDRHGRIKAFNKECEKIWKVREADVLGESVRPFYATDEDAVKVGHALRAAEPDYMIRDYETHIKAGGEIIPIRLSAALLTEEGRILGSIGVFKDQRERRRMEEEKLVREKLAAVGRLAQTFGHGIKNDLAAIQTAVGSLRNASGSNEKIKEACTAIRSSTTAALHKLQNMTMAAKADPVKREIASLRTILEEFESSIAYRATAARIHVSVQYPDDDMLMYAAAEHLAQVLGNLFANSVDAIKARRARGGRTDGAITVDASAQRGFVVLTWRDDGVGMTEEQATKVFTPFFTTKKNGWGVGLSITQAIIEDHGGSIAVEPQTAGVQFVIRLPLQAENREAVHS